MLAPEERSSEALAEAAGGQILSLPLGPGTACGEVLGQAQPRLDQGRGSIPTSTARTC
jgi:hypothetical protein